MIKKKFLLIFLLSCLIFVLITTKGFMLFTDSLQKGMPSISGTISISIVDEVIDAINNIKSFKIQSNGNLPLYIRIKLIPTCEYFDTSEDDWVISNIPLSDISLNVDAQDWILDEGYYYYKNILFEDDKTTDIVISCNVTVTTTLLSDKDVRIVVKIIPESSQIRNDVWKDKFNIDTLPDGVATSYY